uniref:Uncharacterized protein n=1 Tax=Salix viminalis TaxID=40686 RepID=A0A6N2N086_SALVM
MVSLETVQATARSTEPPSSPRISLSADFLDDKNLVSMSPNPQAEEDREAEREKARNAEFEFLSSKMSSQTMLTADELFFEGRLLPFWQMQHSEKLNKISLKTKEAEEVIKEEPRVCSLSDIVAEEEGKRGSRNVEKHVKRIKKGLERTRTASIRIRPMINVPICTPVKSRALPPLFPLTKGRLERRLSTFEMLVDRNFRLRCMVVMDRVNLKLVKTDKTGSGTENVKASRNISKPS